MMDPVRAGKVSVPALRRPEIREAGGPRGVHLTEREREVLGYLALGWETKYIAEELGVSWYTVRSHIENLRRKLGAASRSGGRDGRHAAWASSSRNDLWQVVRTAVVAREAI